jgi:hypothetical protein
MRFGEQCFPGLNTLAKFKKSYRKRLRYTEIAVIFRLINIFFQNFMVDGQSVVEFCNLEVEPMYHESDHIHVTAITQLIGVPVQVIQKKPFNMYSQT